ncbi:tetratricopeptide repeat protein 12-like, partial [Saccoglossus kowalevskii]|uniref:Tetratricopeptide repeat protein 12-like n=1 Tax=Saccoglossus kowalevskii TaxID=10224 RepID=A0ABM0LUF9_SACKO
MAGNTGDDDLEEFLAKVDKLQSIVTGMSSDDKEVQEEFIQKADEELTKEHVSKTVNRTVINKDAYKYDTPEPAPSEPDGQVDQDAFLKNLEADAQARYERKQASRKRATVIKDKGNLAFKNGDFKRAIELYSDAMDIIKDYSDLFTNRAQAYIKISEYDKAIEDCDFAMRIDEKCVKAYITKGRAYLAKKKYTKAISTYEEVLEFDPKQEKIVKEYIAAAKLAKAAAKAEKKVELLYEKGNEEIQTIAELLKKIKKEDQPALYYTGGCQLLVPMLKDKMSCTLFRTHGGFSIISSNEVIIRCMTMSDNLSSEQVDLCSTVLDLYTASCKNIEENQKVLSEMPELLDKCMDMLETSQYPQITEACVVFMYTMSQNDVGKKAIVNKLDIVRLIQSLFELIMASSKVSKEAVDTLTNLATEKRFLHKVYARIKDPVLPLIEKLL